MGTGAVSRYKLESEPVNSPGAGTKLRADAGVRVEKPLRKLIVPAWNEMVINDQKRKRAFGPINHLRFLTGWRLRHQAKTVTRLLTQPSVLCL
ncbi:MAG TPA: hypothetical protein VFM18_24160, partial [Methanosarcina sp.]|nr:hypothetical protein [Methanosarcina sp.]